MPFIRRAILGAAALACAALASPPAARAQTSPVTTPTTTARDAAATWAGFGAAQQLFGQPNAPAPSGITTSGGSYVAPADVDTRDAAPKPAAAPNDGILRSAPPTLGVDAQGRSAVVSGAIIK